VGHLIGGAAASGGAAARGPSLEGLATAQQLLRTRLAASRSAMPKLLPPAPFPSPRRASILEQLQHQQPAQPQQPKFTAKRAQPAGAKRCPAPAAAKARPASRMSAKRAAPAPAPEPSGPSVFVTELETRPTSAAPA
jgi:hypothetical protein